ncbi:MAG: VCBS repeat-containing protein [Methylovulum sp.]|nr:VCBS repeat-containing protein [Methylovulum sp.]
MAIPKLGLTASVNPVEGGAYGEFTITLDSPAPAGGLSVSYNVSGSSAALGEDFTLLAGDNISTVSANAFTIAAGATSATLKLAALADKGADPDETVALNLTESTGYSLVSNATTFADRVDYAAGRTPISVSISDFNNDGKADLAVANSGSNTVSVLLRNATNTGFDEKLDYATGEGPRSVSVGDFNGDGKSDLATANWRGDSAFQC